MLIREDTSIDEFRDAGILPEFIYRDCEEHGMYEAENVLCEWDWEWGWDLGRGYSDEQLDILERVRKTIADGIKAFHDNPTEIERYKEECARKKLREQKIIAFRKQYYGIVFMEHIDWIVDYTLRYGELPCFFFLCSKYLWWSSKLSILQRARLLLAGVGVDKSLSVDEICHRIPKLKKPQVVKLTKEPFTVKGKLADIVTNLHTQLPNRPLTKDDSFWPKLILKQNLQDVQALQLMRIVALVRDDYKIIHDVGKHVLMRMPLES